MGLGFLRDWRINLGARINRENPLVGLDHAIRTSTSENIFNSALSLGKSPLVWDEVVSGAGALSEWISTDICVDMSVSQNNDFIVRQTRTYFNYQAGKPQRCEYTGILPQAEGITARIGSFYGEYTSPHEPLNGMFFETIDGIIYCSIAKNGNIKRIPQDEWLGDRLDGSGDYTHNASGHRLDLSKFQIFSIAYKWLGAGDVMWYVEVDNSPVLVHYDTHANLVTETYTKTGTLPVRYEIRSSGGSATMRHQCSAVTSIGGAPNDGIVGSKDTEGAVISIAAGQTRMIVAARLNPLYANHEIEAVSSYLVNTGVNSSFRYFVAWNPAIGGTPNWIDYFPSAVQTWTGDGNQTISGGLMMDQGGSDKNSRSLSELVHSRQKLGMSINGTPDVIALGVQSIVSTTTIFGGLQMRQLL